MNRSLGLLVLVLFGALTQTACTHVQPWQRGKLAHRTMNVDVAGLAAEHVYAVHEGAVGGGAAAESGCGCN